MNYRYALRAALLVILGLGLAIMAVQWATGCAPISTVQARAQSAIIVLAEVIDPTYSLAVDGCLARERAEMLAEFNGEQDPDDTDRNLAKIRRRCDIVRTSLDVMRGLLVAADAANRAGRSDEAEAKIGEVRKLWASITTEAPEVPP